MKRFSRLMLAALLVLCMAAPLALFAGGQNESAGKPAEQPKKAEPFAIAAFIPGVVAGSPLYEQLVAGAKKAVAEHPNASLKVVEGGFNQAEWPEKVTSLAATGEYKLIISSNPSMPFICADVGKKFPNQKFINVDGYLPGNKQIYTMLYNQVEQGYLAGYMGGLVTTSKMKGANPDLKVGMIVAQEYPALTKMMKPGYLKGLHAVNPKITLDYRIVGNWYDANKAADLANSMFDAGVDVILVIAGGANQGAINAAKERGKYILYFDSNVYSMAPGTIVGCSVLYQEKAVYKVVSEAITGKIKYGNADVVSAADGYVDFVDDDPVYIKTVPEDVRAKMSKVVKDMRSGKLALQVPKL